MYKAAYSPTRYFPLCLLSHSPTSHLPTPLTFLQVGTPAIDDPDCLLSHSPTSYFPYFLHRALRTSDFLVFTAHCSHYLLPVVLIAYFLLFTRLTYCCSFCLLLSVLTSYFAYVLLLRTSRCSYFLLLTCLTAYF